jgi:sugar O-acyltransferase (sialic acid O-acetyltransferase NeuD family)
MSKNKLVIIGAGGHAISCCEVIESAGYEINCFIDANRKYSDLLNIPVISHLSELNTLNKYYYFIAIGDNALREKVAKEMKATYPDIFFPALCHQSAVVSKNSEIGEGTILMPNTVVGTNTTVGRFCILNTSSSIDHDSRMDDFSSLAPGAVTGGTVSIGMRSAISIGAVIKNGVTVGTDSILGANSYLNKDLADKKVAYGTPARIVRDREVGDVYLN